MFTRVLFSIIVLSLIGFSLSGCGSMPIPSQPTSTPMPTYTPAPTYTPVATYTPVPTYTPLGSTVSEGTASSTTVATSEPVAQYTPWPTPATWPTPTPVPGVPEDVEYYVQELVPYLEYMTYAIQAMEQAMYAYADGYITIEDVNATLEIYNEIVVTAYQGALAAIPPETIALIAEQIAGEIEDVHTVAEMINAIPIDQWTPEELDETLEVMAQVRDRTKLVDEALSEEISLFGSGERPNLESLQLQLPDRAGVSLPTRFGEGDAGFEKPEIPDRPQIEMPDRPQIEIPDRPQPQMPEIEKPSLPSRNR